MGQLRSGGFERPGKETPLNFSRNKWITAGLIGLLVLSAAFLGWAIWHSRQRQPAAPATVAQTQTASSPPPPPTYKCPLDGTTQTDRNKTMNRPIVIQIDNAPAARPQSGLSKADIVYEEMAEGQITRYNAIFACRDVDTVGPVRSARLIDLELVPEYQALLSNSGASSGTAAALKAASADVPNLDDATVPSAYRRSSNRYAPHNLYLNTAKLRTAAGSMGLSIQVAINGPQFKPDSPAPAQGQVNNIHVDYSPYADVTFNYDASSNTWLRSVDGSPDVDDLTGTQIAPKNVIIQYVNVTTSNIVEDENGNRGLEFAMTGSGKVEIFRDGQAISGQWQRAAKNAVTTYIDASGAVIPLDVGQTWIEVVPLDFQASWK
ncbi:MAG: DUF3048 domain-containing protein [Actinomycetota bacterium]|nr:DUF3048 domain-containing protein [Actinomycetota bacterium]